MIQLIYVTKFQDGLREDIAMDIEGDKLLERNDASHSQTATILSRLVVIQNVDDSLSVTLS